MSSEFLKTSATVLANAFANKLINILSQTETRIVNYIYGGEKKQIDPFLLMNTFINRPNEEIQVTPTISIIYRENGVLDIVSSISHEEISNFISIIKVCSSRERENRYCFRLIERDDGTFSYKCYNITNNTTTFNSIFFQQKKMLIKILDDMNTCARSLFLLLYGESGTGKTSIIRAISHYTKRHIVDVRLSEIKDVESIFYNGYNGNSLHNLIFVFENINDVQSKHILNVFNGLVEFNGCIIIFTTNDYDSNILYDNRINILKLHMTRLTPEYANTMIYQHFGEILDFRIIEKYDFIPSELENLCKQSSTFEDFKERLSKYTTNTA